MQKYSTFICLALIPLQSLLVNIAWASNPLDDQRYAYELAKSALQKGNIKEFDKHYQQLGDYPLKPYLDYALATDTLNSTDTRIAEQFINHHRDTYLGDRLYRQFLYSLASKKRWNDLIYWYQPKVASVAVNCAWLQARNETGDQIALSQVKNIWVKAKSLPKACDPLFKQWMTSDYFDNSIVWQRYLLAINKGNNGLARYLASTLPDSYQHYISLINTLRTHPYRIGKYKLFDTHTPEMQAVIAYGVRKYARRHPKEAFTYWERYEAKQIFDDQLAKSTKLYIVQRLLRKGFVDDVQTILANSSSLRSSNTMEHLVRKLLKEQRWQDVAAVIKIMPEDKRQQDRWRYWAARSQDLRAGNINYDSALTYKHLSEKRSFYGFMAADRLGEPYTLQNQPVVFDESLLAALEQQRSLIRAKELRLTGHFSEAYAEWAYGLDKLSSRELMAVGVLADRWGWHDSAINAMIAGKHWNHLGIRFPLAYKEYVFGAAASTNLEPEFIFAIARQESAMSESAQSSAGARGLMQLLPSTAKQTARKQGIPHKTEDLYTAEHNINLGSRYLDELVDRFSGNRILAAAAYNAGPHRVNKWINATTEKLPFDVWIETIPYRETRGYVQNVLTFSVIYSFRMGKPESLVTKSEAKRKL